MHKNDNRLLDGCGLWLERCSNFANNGRPALFLDRDGVIVEETHYLGCARDVRMIESAGKCIRYANELGIAVVVVTNQAGIGRGYYDWGAFARVQDKICHELNQERARLDLVLACAYHGDGIPPFNQPEHPWRKPQGGMFLKARELLDLNLRASLIIGDKLSDLMAGVAAGVGHGILVRTGHGQKELQTFNSRDFADMKVESAGDLHDAFLSAVSNGWLNCSAGKV